MKYCHTIPLLAMVSLLGGCATSSKVQEMIDASNRDQSSQIRAHEESISVLKQSTMAGLEKSADNAKRLTELEKRTAALAQQLAIVQDLASASKVISAENTVRVSDLEERVDSNKEEADKIIARMAAIDKLYEKVLIRQFQEIVDSANAAIASLKEDGFSASTNAPVKLDEPIEIIAPDTAIPTNTSDPAPPL